MTEAKKRGRGRPKKEEKEEKVENPDCEPATKGFVKCLMRKYDSGHTHEQRSGGGPMTLLALVFILAWCILATLKPGCVDPVYTWMVGLLAVVSIVAQHTKVSLLGNGEPQSQTTRCGLTTQTTLRSTNRRSANQRKGVSNTHF